MPARQLLTGMSDGGTFSYVLGLRERLPLHPSRADRGGVPSADDDDHGRRRPRARPADPHRARRAGLDVPAQLARSAEQTLAQAGAEVVYREIADLSHTYPRDENGAILDWFMS